LLQRLLHPRYTLHVHGNTAFEQRQEVQALISEQLNVVYIEDDTKGYVLCGDAMCFPKVGTLEEVMGQME